MAPRVSLRKFYDLFIKSYQTRLDSDVDIVRDMKFDVPSATLELWVRELGLPYRPSRRST